MDQELAESFYEDRDQLRNYATQQILNIQQENQRSYNSKRKQAIKYDIGDHVAIQRTQFGSGLKLKPKNFGPYKIIKNKGRERYSVEKVGIHDGPYITETSADHMIPWPQEDNTNKIYMLRFFTNIFHSIRSPQTIKCQPTIIIEGNIAAGKTTLTRWISNHTNYLVIPEPLDVWHNLNGFNLLKAYYEDRNTWAITFQMYAMLTILKRHGYETKQPIKIMERSILSMSKCFIPLMLDENIINKPQQDVLLEWLKFIEGVFQIHVDAIIYLRTTPEISYRRIKDRNRPGENKITLDYLDKLHKKYDQWLLRDTEIQIFEIDATQNFIEVAQNVTTIFSSFEV